MEGLLSSTGHQGGSETKASRAEVAESQTSGAKSTSSPFKTRPKFGASLSLSMQQGLSSGQAALLLACSFGLGQLFLSSRWKGKGGQERHTGRPACSPQLAPQGEAESFLYMRKLFTPALMV